MSDLESFHIRPARADEIGQLEALIAVSARDLSREDYSDAEIETAITHVFGVDSELVADQTYYTVTHGDGIVGEEIVACGGWSRRRTLFGGDRFGGRESGFLDPATDAAKIRAFFVHPAWARRGIGRALLSHCEAGARAHGFTRAEMMATLPGIKLYRTCGYEGSETVVYTAPDGATVRFMPMMRTL